ncbi:hypothetical protein [Salinisphaera orenii]|uniref:hypothetical protein n=1 Tax=Salinisphaera orenii TaxID=856731 RepID=UPI0011CE0493|nr:hypothetical protein [Salinisphaera halophila]
MPLKLTSDSLKAEAAELRQLLVEAQRFGDVVGEIQYNERLEEISRELYELAESDANLASVALFFSGKPVVGSRGIAADFAGKLLESYQDIVSKAFAKAEIGALGERGRVPMKQSTDLMVTGLTHGSFGFVLEELSDQAEIHDTALKEVLSSVSDLLRHVGAENESEFDEAAEDLDPRTLVALRDFFKRLDSSEAAVRFVEGQREFFLDEKAVHRGRVRTEAIEIDEKSALLEGILIGFLPDHRKFELRDQTGVTIYGAVSKEAAEQFESAVQYQGPVIGEPCKAEFIVREVRPINQAPRLSYRLIGFHRLGSSA